MSVGKCPHGHGLGLVLWQRVRAVSEEQAMRKCPHGHMSPMGMLRAVCKCLQASMMHANGGHADGKAGETLPCMPRGQAGKAGETTAECMSERVRTCLEERHSGHSLEERHSVCVSVQRAEVVGAGGAMESVNRSITIFNNAPQPLHMSLTLAGSLDALVGTRRSRARSPAVDRLFVCR